MNLRLPSIFATAVLIATCGSMAMAQNYDDDDIYYNPSKSKQQPKETKTVTKAPVYTIYDYPSADVYVPADGSGVKIDVDTYNRRGVFAQADTTRQQTPTTDFNCTRNIERFINPDVIAESSDGDLATIYYSQPSTINIYVDNTPTGYWGWGSPYYGSAYWGWGYTRPWTSWGWGWNWGWDPYWAWSPAWNWGASWGWGWGGPWGWGGAWGPSYGWATPSRPNRPSGNVRPGYAHSRPGGSIRPSSGYARPSARPSAGSSNSGYRPGKGSIRPGQSNTRPGTNSYRDNNNYNNNNYRQQNTIRNSSGSFGSGGYRGGGSMGGGMRGGGGGGRGRH